MSVEADGVRYYEAVRRTLSAWVQYWFDQVDSDWLVASALQSTYMCAVNGVETSHGAYAKVFEYLEKGMRRLSYSTGAVIPLGLHRMYPRPDNEVLEGFSGMYASVSHLFDVAGMTWDETLDIAVALGMYGSHRFKWSPESPEMLTYHDGIHHLVWLCSIFEGHAHEGPGCSASVERLSREWQKTAKWARRHPVREAREVNHGKASEDNDSRFSGSFFSED